MTRIYKSGKLNKFKRSRNGQAKTRIFVECQNCPNFKKYKSYLVAGSELRKTHLMGNDPFYNGVINANDLAVSVKRGRNVQGEILDILHTCKPV